MFNANVLRALDRAPGGLLSARQLRALGLTYPQLVDAGQRDLLVRPLHGVYGLPVARPDRHLALPLVYLDQRRRPTHMPAALTGAVGLALRGVAPFSLDGPPDVLVDARCRARTEHNRFRVIRGGGPALPLNRVGGLRVAPIDRCLIDAAGSLDVEDGDLLAAIDSVRNQRLATLPQLARTWRSSRATGVARLERMSRRPEIEMESDGERDFFNRVLRRHQPWPDFQVVMVGAIRVDFVFISAGLVIEYYGKQSHADRVDEDGTRVGVLERRHLRVIVVTNGMLLDAAGLGVHIHQIRRDRERRISTGELPMAQLPPQPERLTPLRSLWSSPQRRSA